MQTTADQNNKAVALIRSRNSIAAAKIFSETLRSFQEFATNRNSFSSASESANATGASNCLDQGMLLPKVDDKKDDFFANNDYIYDQGIMIHHKLTDPIMVSTILIFNAALSHQLCAKQYPEKSTQYLLQARSMYAMAYQMQGTCSNMNNTLFRVAVINNAAVIERELGNEIACRMFFDCLMSIWALSVDQENSSRLVHMRSFLWNILRKNDAAGAA